MRKVYHYTVSGFGTFPFDMLRRDQCWPKSTEDVTNMEPFGSDDLKGAMRRKVQLCSYCLPTYDRWKSFMWPVIMFNGKVLS